MDLEQMLGIDLSDPQQRLAQELVAADDRLLAELTELREKSGQSQEEIGKRMGVGQSAVARIESGDRDPRLSTIRRYAHAVGAVVTHTVVPLEKDERVSVQELNQLGRRGPEWGNVGTLAPRLVGHSK